jgi:regulator of sigma E protease
MTILIFIIILAILVFVHELGHFLSAKKSGVRVDEFAVGFPPKIFKKKYKGTEYSIGTIPFGGFVKIFGEDPHQEKIEEADKEKSFYYKPKTTRIFILSAGIIMNILFAYLLISFGFMIGLPTGEGHSRFGSVQNPQLTITSVMPGSPAYKSGIKTGDIVLFAESGSFNIQNPKADDLSNLINTADSQISLLIKRGDSIPLNVTVESIENPDLKRKVIGVSLDDLGILKLNPALALLEGLITTKNIFIGTFVGLLGFIKDLFTSSGALAVVSGPVGIATFVGQARTLGFIYLLSLTAMISLNLAVINLIPFPALDGGRILFVLIEALVGRRINPKFETWANVVGFSLLIILMIFVTVGDVKRFF